VRESIFSFADKSEFQPDTNLAGGLLEALEDEGIDTVFLLTDGSPNCGDFVSAGRVREGVRPRQQDAQDRHPHDRLRVTSDSTREFLKDLPPRTAGRSVFR